ncbi:MAG TPA: histidine kinase dimerization/phospho-acceptor domain-containing protein, partial [Acidobacteriota bacterium]|nr:histidine kinase dimerization/phospho-acceptor domain-containing protein [Acidobacteriota bacterium]
MFRLLFRGLGRNSGIKAMIYLALPLFAINAVGIWGIIASKRNAEALALEELRLQANANAMSVEAVLSSRRGDFIFLSQSPPLADALEELRNANPIARKWGRLDVEGTLLLFLAAHPEVERLVIRNSRSEPMVVAGRRDGAPVLLPIRESAERTPVTDGLLVSSWPLRAAPSGQTGSLETVLNVSALLRVAVPGMPSQFALLQKDDPVPDSTKHDSDLIAISVRDPGWPEPVRWSLVCDTSHSHLLGSFTAMADRYRLAVVLNLVIMSFALAIGFLGFRQVRRTMALEEQNRQQARMRELERQVVHNERLASIGRLAAGMAHEINNPLEGMSNYLSLLEADLQSGSTNGSLELAGRIREGLERAAGIIRQVLNFADPGSAPHAPVDLNEVLDE